MKTNVYVDGFNLYYGIRETDATCKWLDLAKLCELLLPGHAIHRIKYFTATVTDLRPGDGTADRQQVYLRALRTIPNLSIHRGKFLSYPARMPLQNPRPNRDPCAAVIRTEEKGSDVNLATHLLMDGVRNDYEQAVIITNDSDQLSPIRVVRQEFRKPLGILNPHSGTTSLALKNAASFYKPIRAGVLRASQFPDTIPVLGGTAIAKPATW
jgi:hypothetical protein